MSTSRKRSRYSDLQRPFLINRDTTIKGFGAGAVPNNEVRVNFSGAENFNNCELALIRASCYKSWFNITAALGNNQLSYTIPTSTSNPAAITTFTITLPDGIYEVADIQTSLQNYMYQNKHYFRPKTDPTLPPVYPIQITSDPIRYRCSITAIPLYPPPDRAGDATSVEYEWAAAPTTTIPYHPSIFIPVSSNPDAAAGGTSNFSSTMGRVLGFSTGYAPDITQNPPYALTETGDFYPQITLQNQILFNCDLVNNANNTTYNNCIGQFVPRGKSGEPMQFEPNNIIWHPMNDGTKYAITISLTDEHNIPLDIQDPVVTVDIVIRQRDAFLD